MLSGTPATVALLSLLLPACRPGSGVMPATQPPPEPRLAGHHRPDWLQRADLHLAAMSACLEGREAPSYVVYVYHAPDRTTAVSTVDAHGALEHCVVGGNEVLVREPAAEAIADLAGLPLFSVGPAQPALPPETVVEDVVLDDTLIGWLHWPAPPLTRSPAARR